MPSNFMEKNQKLYIDLKYNRYMTDDRNRITLFQIYS